MKKLLRLLIIVPFLMTAQSCAKFLDVVPEEDILSLESIFERKSQTVAWFKTCYAYMNSVRANINKTPDALGTDEVVAGDFLKYGQAAFGHYFHGIMIGSGLQNKVAPYGDIWNGDYRQADVAYEAIRYINIFLERVKLTTETDNGLGMPYDMTDEEKIYMRAELKVLKANFYFELVRRYGPIVLVPENLSVDSPDAELQIPRTSVEECFQTMIELIDEAMPDLMSINPDVENGKSIFQQAYHSSEGAEFLKALILFYRASPLFTDQNGYYRSFTNRDGEFMFGKSTTSYVEYTMDDRKAMWLEAEAQIEKAIEVAHAGGVKLFDEGTRLGKRSTELLNYMYNIEYSVLCPNFGNIEAVYVTKYTDNFNFPSLVLPKFPTENTFEHYEHSGEHQGGLAASLKQVEKYYTKNGLPIQYDSDWQYSARYRLDRTTDTKYDQVIALDSTTLRLHLEREPRFYAHIASDRTYWQRGDRSVDNLLVKVYRDETFGTQEQTIGQTFSQNLSGYYIKKRVYSDIHTGSYRQSIQQKNDGVAVFRLAELYLMITEARNESGAYSDNNYIFEYMDLVRERAGIPTTQVSWSTYSTEPSKLNDQVGRREVIQREWDIEFAYEGHRFWNLRRWLTAHVELNGTLLGWNILGNNNVEFYNMNDAGGEARPIELRQADVVNKFVYPRDYLFPIRDEQVLISGAKQNPGW